MDSGIGTYYAVYFEDVASAVKYCHDLVPYIVPRPGVLAGGDGRPVVWFHVPRRSTATTRDGCYLFASAGAIGAAQRAGLDPEISGCVPRSALPRESVLLFGEDAPEVAPEPKAPQAPAQRLWHLPPSDVHPAPPRVEARR